MEENKKSGIGMLIMTLISFYSMSLYAIVFTAGFYLLKWCTGLEMESSSFFHSFVFVAVVTILLPFTFFIDFLISSLYDTFFSRLPKIPFVFVTKVSEVLLLSWIMYQVDEVIDGITLSTYAELLFSYVVFLLAEWFISKGGKALFQKPKKEQPDKRKEEE